MTSIRKKYESLGVEDYYKSEGSNYDNPHFPEIKSLIFQNQHRIDYSNILDFCCGAGEVSRCILEMGYKQVSASDPYTQKAYFKNIEKECWSFSFEDVIKGKLQGQFSAIISSFALHLCPDDQLFALSYQLFQCTDTLVILTPHKRPELEKLEGISLLFEDFTLTKRGKKVRLKAYTSSF